MEKTAKVLPKQQGNDIERTMAGVTSNVSQRLCLLDSSDDVPSSAGRYGGA